MENYAGKSDKDKEIIEELKIAGIEVNNYIYTQDDREVKTSVFGYLHQWVFHRAWYYWTAEGPGIPPKYANSLHEKYGKDVRVNGNAGSPSPKEQFKGFAVGCYHIDTQEGLNALANTIRQVIKEASIVFLADG